MEAFNLYIQDNVQTIISCGNGSPCKRGNVYWSFLNPQNNFTKSLPSSATEWYHNIQTFQYNSGAIINVDIVNYTVDSLSPSQSPTQPTESPSQAPTIFTLSLVQSFGFRTGVSPASVSIYPGNITLNYDSIIYHCQIIPTAASTEFSCLGNESFVTADCGIDKNMIFVENTHYVDSGNIDGIEIDTIFIVLNNGSRITITYSPIIYLDENERQSNIVLTDIDQQTWDQVSPNFYPDNCTITTESPTEGPSAAPTTASPTTEGRS